MKKRIPKNKDIEPPKEDIIIENGQPTFLQVMTKIVKTKHKTRKTS